jgi:ribosomal protein S18 acetylase RimI-like enzyme
MLIRFANEKDLPAWYTLATEVSEIFQHPGCMGEQHGAFCRATSPADMGAELRSKASGKGSVSRYEMLTAVDYMSGDNMGFICFSRTENTVSWFAVSERYRGKGAGERLLKTALRQLDTNKDITVMTFTTEYPSGAAAR